LELVKTLVSKGFHARDDKHSLMSKVLSIELLRSGYSNSADRCYDDGHGPGAFEETGTGIK